MMRAKSLFGAFLLLQVVLFSFCSQSFAQSRPDEIYRLDSGDKLKITVYGEEDLSGEIEVDGEGTLSLPLIGEVTVKGMALREIENLISDKYRDGYLLSPKVSVELLNSRPFFILGEVNAPGSYPYVNGLTVLNAVAIAGGYTYRAKTSKFFVKRIVDGKTFELDADEASKVLPGDVIQVKERFF